MYSYVDVELVGGPEDGRTVTVPRNEAGGPELRELCFPHLPLELSDCDCDVDEAEFQQLMDAAPMLHYHRPQHVGGRWTYAFSGRITHC